MFVAALSTRVASALAPARLVGQVRWRKGKVLAQKMWDGWPKFSPDGWPYARYMKQVRGKDYMSKQAWRRLQGKERGTCARKKMPRSRTDRRAFILLTVACNLCACRRTCKGAAGENPRRARVYFHVLRSRGPFGRDAAAIVKRSSKYSLSIPHTTYSSYSSAHVS